MTTENEKNESKLEKTEELIEELRILQEDYKTLKKESEKTEEYVQEEIVKIKTLKAKIKTLEKQISNLKAGKDIDEDSTFWESSKKYFVIGGLAVVAVAGYFLFKSDGVEEVLTDIEEPIIDTI